MSQRMRQYVTGAQKKSSGILKALSESTNRPVVFLITEKLKE